jgi:hypothetical protein
MGLERGHEIMDKQLLKDKAISISNVPSHYVLKIENYGEGIICYMWEHPDDEEESIWVELDLSGRLIDLSKYIHVSEMSIRLSVDKLQETSLQFVSSHYPDAPLIFPCTEIKEFHDGEAVSFTYCEIAEGLPLPLTGFHVTITNNGEIIHFKYYGAAKRVLKPKRFLDKGELINNYLNELEMELKIVPINDAIYLNAENAPKLVYEPRFAYYIHPVDSLHRRFPIEEEEDLESEELFPLPPKQNTDLDLDKIIGLNRSVFFKLRENDMDETIGTVWSKEKIQNNPQGQDINQYFESRNQNTLKIFTNKETGKLTGLISFLEDAGPLELKVHECKRIAVQFLYAVYPNADQFFMLSEPNSDPEDAMVSCRFALQYHGTPVELGMAVVSVNTTTGLVTMFAGPDIDPEKLTSINPEPSISKEQANDLFAAEFNLTIEWQKEYDDGDEFYQLVYTADFPGLDGELAFIGADDAKLIMRKRL